MNSIAFKTVRHEGSSVWAVPPLAQTYHVGQKYTLPPELPAHFFSIDDIIRDEGMPLCWSSVYEQRREGCGGNRVLIALGEFTRRSVPVW